MLFMNGLHVVYFQFKYVFNSFNCVKLQFKLRLLTQMQKGKAIYM